MSKRADPDAPLTAKEIAVLELIALGLSNKQISRRLCRAPGTVGDHIKHLLVKLGACTRAHAVTIGFNKGLLTVEEAEPPVLSAGQRGLGGAVTTVTQ